MNAACVVDISGVWLSVDPVLIFLVRAFWTFYRGDFAIPAILFDPIKREIESLRFL